jgi:predicted phosphodiesterase
MKELVLDYISKYPYLPKRALAKIMFAENPGIFKDIGHARDSLRYYMGARGQDSRIHEGNVPLLPAEISKDYSPYVIPKVNDRILVLSDIHIPFQDNNAIKLAVEYGKHVEVNTVLLNGDIFDFYSGSRFVKDPRLVDWKTEVKLAKEFLTWLRSEFPEAKIIFKVGNHEERFEIYMKQNAPLLFQTDMYHVEDLLGLVEFGIDVVGDKRIIRAGKLNILHGHELRSFSGGVNPARTAYLQTHKSVLVGHYHRTSLHTEPDLEKKVVTCWSTGCLCSLWAEYDLYNKWNHGFAVVYNDGELFEVENLRIVNGKVVN